MTGAGDSGLWVWSHAHNPPALFGHILSGTPGSKCAYLASMSSIKRSIENYTGKRLTMLTERVDSVNQRTTAYGDEHLRLLSRALCESTGEVADVAPVVPSSPAVPQSKGWGDQYEDIREIRLARESARFSNGNHFVWAQRHASKSLEIVTATFTNDLRQSTIAVSALRRLGYPTDKSYIDDFCWGYSGLEWKMTLKVEERSGRDIFLAMDDIAFLLRDEERQNASYNSDEHREPQDVEDLVRQRLSPPRETSGKRKVSPDIGLGEEAPRFGFSTRR
jgi:hypothetical protein